MQTRTKSVLTSDFHIMQDSVFEGVKICKSPLDTAKRFLSRFQEVRNVSLTLDGLLVKIMYYDEKPSEDYSGNKWLPCKYDWKR